jgi:putative transposase
VIDTAFTELAPVVSTTRACTLLGRSRATHYRRQVPPGAGAGSPRPAPPTALTEAERQHVLTVLRSAQYCDLAPAQVWARLLDDGVSLCSISTMYRLLAPAVVRLLTTRGLLRVRVCGLSGLPQMMDTRSRVSWR